MKNIKYLSYILIISLVTCFIYGCSSDTVTNINNIVTGNSSRPVFRFITGQTFKYNNDSLIYNYPNITTQRTSIVSTDVVLNKITLDGYECFPIISTSVDTVSSTNLGSDTAYIRYDSTNGKFYQYGISRLINPVQPPAWDLIADFSVARGTEWTIGTINYTVTLPPPYGTINFSGPLKSKVADSLSIQTTSNPPHTIHCYKIQITANVSGIYIGLTLAATIVVDYYLSYFSSQFSGNPSCIARVRLNPFPFTLQGNPVFYQSGYDRILQTYTP